MKIDVRLFDLLLKVPNESVHYLSRDEIVAFGIDTREFPESRWIATELLPRQLWTMKYFVDRKGQDGKELRTSVVRLECGDPSRTKVNYIRGQGPDEKSAGQRTIKFAAGNQTVSLTAYGSPAKLDAIESGTLFAWAYMYVRYDFFEAAAAGQFVSIIETDMLNPIPRITKLSTAGLSQAIATMRQRCNGV